MTGAALTTLASAMAEANLEWGDPVKAWGRCYEASCRLLMTYEEHGVRARLWQAEWATGRHFAVESDGVVVDLTFRQFWEDAPFPMTVTVADWEQMLLKHVVGVEAVEVGPERD
jgi:hypothetical protein